MASTYEPIATQTLGSSAATVTFSSIPSTYTDLVVVFTGQQTPATTANGAYFTLNNDTGNNYSRTDIDGDGTTASSGRSTSAPYIQNIVFKNVQNTTIINIFNYANSTTYKTILSRTNTSNQSVNAIAGLWRSTAAINRIDFAIQSAQSFTAGSTFTIYGIKAA